MIALVDAEGVIVGCAGETGPVLGCPVKDVLGRPMARFLPESQDADRPTAATGLTGGRQGWMGIVAGHRPDGRPCRLGVFTWPLSGDLEAAHLVALVEVSQRSWWDASLPALQRFFNDAPIGISITDPHLRNVWINSALERIIGIPAAHRAGKMLSELSEFPRDLTLAVESAMRGVIETGKPVLDYEYLLRSPAHPYRDRAYSASFFRLEDAFEQTLGLCMVIVDVNDRWRAREHLALLNEAGEHTGRTLDVADAAQALADIGVPRLADRAVVDLLDVVPEAGRPYLPRSGEPLVMRRAGLRSASDAGLGPIAPTGELQSHGPASPYRRCLVDDVTYTGPDMGADPGAWKAVSSARSVHDDALAASVITVPISVPNRPLGVATFVRRPEEPFEHDELLTCEAVVRRAAVNIDNALRFAHERTTALALQRELLPRGLTVSPTVEVASCYVPAQSSNGVGGDWFDVIPLSGARSAFVVGDVVGHGVHAAASMGRYRTVIRTLANMDLPPDEVLAHLDDLIIGMEPGSATDEPQELAGIGATCLVAIYDPVGRSCSMARAGHPPLAIAAPDGTVSFPELPAGPPLGLGGLPFTSTEVQVEDGSVLALFTDGLIETRERDAHAGLRQLAAVLSRQRQPLDALGQSALAALVDGSPEDDVALLLARVHGLGPDSVFTWSLPSDPKAVTLARSAAVDCLRERQLGALEFEVELTVSELVTNAIRYGSGPDLRLRLIRKDAGVICEVSDGANTSPRLRHARTTDEGGRGLFLVARLAHRWGTRFKQEGKTVWAELNVPDASR
ncbi:MULTISPECIES: ATP-binding SpoIIE family protein phosphatase [unclassified Streptomyces]|uniref:ATP-binding SpoIIE family protein phosphatase n=1 Tax=unclassified Streptomyces TaxID=2593676 RepID=UPI0013016007|nr:SpoIIE family protein phosphatase [Streptomyces sp. TSRI0107]